MFPARLVGPMKALNHGKPSPRNFVAFKFRYYQFSISVARFPSAAFFEFFHFKLSDISYLRFRARYRAQVLTARKLFLSLV